MRSSFVPKFSKLRDSRTLGSGPSTARGCTPSAAGAWTTGVSATAATSDAAGRSPVGRALPAGAETGGATTTTGGAETVGATAVSCGGTEAAAILGDEATDAAVAIAGAAATGVARFMANSEPTNASANSASGMRVFRAFKARRSSTGPVLRPHVRGETARAAAVAIARAPDPDFVATPPVAAGF